MSYNKAREENKWKKWKEGEENKLRKMNTSEELILMLREYDWNQFKSDRRFYEKQKTYEETYFNNRTNQSNKKYYDKLESILDELIDVDLYKCILNSDCITQKIVLLKMNDYTIKDISIYLKITPNVVYKKVHNLRKKYKKMAKK